MKEIRRAWSELSESVLEHETFASNAQEIPAELDLQRKISEIMSGLRPPPESYDDGDQSPLSGDAAQFLRNQWAKGMDYAPWEPMFSYISPWLKAVFSGDFDSVVKMLEGKSEAEIKRMIAKRETLMNVSAIFHVIVGARTFAESHPKLEEIQKLCRRHLNVRNEHLKILEKLLSLGADVNIRDVAGFTPLHCCAQFHGNKTTTRMAGILIKAGANIDAQNRFGATPLLDATLCNHYDMVKVLSESGADFFIKDNDGSSPFSVSNVNLKTSKIFSEEMKKRASHERERLREEAGGSFSKCSVCKRTENTKRCTGCYFVWYCGRRCQEEHWPRHKEECKVITDSSVRGQENYVTLQAVQKEYMECVTADTPISILTASNKVTKFSIELLSYN